MFQLDFTKQERVDPIEDEFLNRSPRYAGYKEFI